MNIDMAKMHVPERYTARAAQRIFFCSAITFQAFLPRGFRLGYSLSLSLLVNAGLHRTCVALVLFSFILLFYFFVAVARLVSTLPFFSKQSPDAVVPFKYHPPPPPVVDRTLDSSLINHTTSSPHFPPPSPSLFASLSIPLSLSLSVSQKVPPPPQKPSSFFLAPRAVTCGAHPHDTHSLSLSLLRSPIL